MATAQAEAPTASAAAFLDAVERSRLLPAGDVARIAESARAIPAAALAEALVESRLLTRWQADHLLQGEAVFHLGEYVLLDHIATGGMGTVYRGRHRDGGPEVALKLLSAEATKDPIVVERFRREVALASSLRHPTIVRALDSEFRPGLCFVVMELVEGQDLWEWGQTHGPLPTDFACECVRQACVALECADAHGVAHRDLKPANLMVSWLDPARPPLVKVLDMGLARVRSEGLGLAELTRTGQFVGTPEYVAPEQAANAKAADIRADIYALGVTLYELLSAKLPFDAAEPMESIVRRQTEDPPRLSARLPDLPPDLDDLIFRMMARDRGRRPQRPLDVARVVEPFCGLMRNPDID